MLQVSVYNYRQLIARVDHQWQGDAKKKKKKKKHKKKKLEQSDPPRVGLSKLFPSGIYPEGEIQPYKDESVPLYLTFFNGRSDVYTKQ